MALDLTDHPNVGEAFAERAAAAPERTALTRFRGSAAEQDEDLSFAELARRAGARAAGFAARLDPGDRVLIVLPTCQEFVEVYLACLLAGVVAVPAPVPGGSANAAERVAAIIRDCAPAMAITSDGDRSKLEEELHGFGLENIVVEPAGAVGPGPVPDLSSHRPPPTPDTLAVIQYSSGSTATPKGVMLAHGDILANVAAFGRALRVGPDDVFGIWIPMHHDMGLFAQLTLALLHGAPVVLMTPSEFLRRPVEWFRMMYRYAVTVTAAPNFAYELCKRVITDEQLDSLDLSRLRIALDGAEPIQASSMTAFAERFARAGLQASAMTPGYGLAEATVYVSVKAVNMLPTVLAADPACLESVRRSELRPASGEGRDIVGVGRPKSLQARIVDPESRRGLGAGAIGEIWVRGPGKGRGYWNKPELSEEIFEARLSGHRDGDPVWLRTGDLGAFVGGELFVTGRAKELLIVHGRNLYPHDLEQEARAAHAALEGFVGAVFGVAAPEERIVLVHEVRPGLAAEELPAVAAAVARRLTIAVGAPFRNILLVRRGTVHRTTSGKIRRGAMRDHFLAGGIVALYSDLEPRVLAAVGKADA